MRHRLVAISLLVLSLISTVARAATSPAKKTPKPSSKSSSSSAASSAGGERIEVRPFGTVTLYRKTPHPSHVVVFISGDGGWNLGVVDMARELVPLDALVIGVDIRSYLKGAIPATDCFDAGRDYAAIARAVENQVGYPKFVPPILVGYSSGATLVYAAIVQAPPHTFAGAMSLGFCPDMPLHPPICRGQGLEWDLMKSGNGLNFRPYGGGLQEPWVAFQGEIDKVCDPPSTKRFLTKVPGGELVWLPHVGHGYSVPRNWLPQFKQQFTELAKRGR
jgi:pimeloyl-ACP methyl ester carboxylesterase